MDGREIQVKLVTQPDGRTRWKSEHDDVLRIAQEQNLDYPTAKANIDHDVRQQLEASVDGAS